MKGTGNPWADRVLKELSCCYIDSKVSAATHALIRTLVAERSGPGAVRRVVKMRFARQRRIYIAGPMTGLPDLNFPLFNATAARLRSEHWHVENPAEHGNVKDAVWGDYLRYDLSRVVTCGAIYLLPGWSKSDGATLEVDVAKRLGLAIILADGAEATPDAAESEALRCAEWMEHIAGGGEVVSIDALARTTALELRNLHALAARPTPGAQDAKDAERFRGMWEAAKREDKVFDAVFHEDDTEPETLDELRVIFDRALAASAKQKGTVV